MNTLLLPFIFKHLSFIFKALKCILWILRALVKGRMALLTKITLHIKFAILINYTLIENSKNTPSFLKFKICDFLWSDFLPIFVTTGTDRQPSLVSTATDRQPKVAAYSILYFKCTLFLEFLTFEGSQSFKYNIQYQ